MRFRVLGPLEVVGDEGPLLIRGRHHPKLLAILLDQSNRVVPVDRCVAGLWDGVPPESARQQVQNVVAGLRRQLGSGGGRLETLGAGYRLNVEPTELDLLRCETRAFEASRLRETGRCEDAVVELRAALAEWRGSAMAGLEGRMVETAARRLEEYRLVLLEERLEIELSLGCDPSAELCRLTAEHPLRQRFAEQCMLALHRSGRTPESLAFYADLRERLADELGIDPGRRLRELHTAILRDDPGLAAPPRAASASPDRPAVTPALLPADIAAFAGRGDHLEALDELLDDDPESVRLAVLTGAGGAGKTALAVHWAHRVADRFPDGQLFVDLRGFDAHDEALAPDDAVRMFLEVLGVEHERIPAEPDARIGLYRSLLAERRVLIVLDNAAEAAQVRPLLSGGAGNRTLITSRSPLSGLVAAQGARTRPVRELSADEAHAFLERRLGRTRICAEPEAAEAIIERCARLPLALAIAAARAAHTDFALADLAREIETTGDRLDALSGDDPATDIRTVFDCSYRALTPSAARLFRLLGLHPGTDLTASAAASLTAVPHRRARSALTELAGAHLLTEHRPGRYTCHDLLRAYAAELVTETDDRTERDTATGRLLDHYAQTGRLASGLVKPDREPIASSPPHPGAVPEPLSDAKAAMSWLAAEHRTLRAAVGLAADAGLDALTWQLASTLVDFAFLRGRLHDSAAAQRMALEAAARLGDALGQIYSHRMIATHLAEQSEFEDAEHHLKQALALCDQVRDRATLAELHLNISLIQSQRDRYTEAVHHGHQALDLFQRLGSEQREAGVLNALGWYYAHLDRCDEALSYCERSLAMQIGLDAEVGQASTWDSIGYIHQRQGRLDRALECFRTSLELSRETGHRYNEAEALEHLGDTCLALGDAVGARDAWEQAIAALDDHGPHLLVRTVREKIANLRRSQRSGEGGRPVPSRLNGDALDDAVGPPGDGELVGDP